MTFNLFPVSKSVDNNRSTTISLIVLFQYMQLMILPKTNRMAISFLNIKKIASEELKMIGLNEINTKKRAKFLFKERISCSY